MKMIRIRFRLSTLLLLTATIAAGLATQNRRSAWYVSKSIPSGAEGDFELAAFEDQDLLACLKTTGPKRLVVRQLSTGKVLHEFDDDSWQIRFLQAGQDGKLYGFGAYRVIRIDLQTSESTELMTGSDGPPEQLLVKGVSPDGRLVLLAVQDVVVLPSGRGIIRPLTPVTYRVRDLVTGGLQWELKTTDTQGSAGAFLSDGKRIALHIDHQLQIWDYGKNVRTDESSAFNLFSNRSPLLFPDGRRFLTTSSIRNLHSGVDLERLFIGFKRAIVNDSFFISSSDGQLNYWRRRRVEGSWSPLSFPEAWVTGALAIALMFNVVGYWRRRRSHAEHVASR